MRALVVVVLVVVFAAGSWLSRADRTLAPPRIEPAGPIDLGPVRGFVANQGQWPTAVRFAAAAGGDWLHVTDHEVRSGNHLDAIAMRARSDRNLPPVPIDLATTVCNFLIGNDPTRHVRGAPVCGSVRKPEIAPGVDLVLRRATDGPGFAYDLWCAANANLAAVEFEVDGITTLAVDADSGELVLSTGTRELRQSVPKAYCIHAGGRTPIPVHFEMRGARRFGFVGEPMPADAILHVDPDLRWSTTVGGSLFDAAYGLSVAANGDTFVAGSTVSTNLPTAGPVFDPTYNGANPVPFVVGDSFVARFAAGSGALVWCTYLGGAENDRMQCAGAFGDDAMVTGWTSSTDFPTTPLAFDTTHNGTGDGYVYSGGDVFVTRLAGNGQSLVWSTFLGGAMLEYPTSMAVAANGEVAVAGHVHSLNFPVTPGAWSSTRSGYSDFFVTRIAANGQTLVGSTYCGGTDQEEYPFAMAIAPNGDIVVAGATDSLNLPVTPGAYDTTFNGGSEHFADGFAARFDRTCSQLHWCTYLGTPGNEYPRGMAMHADGSMTFSGQIDAPGLPATPGVFGPAPFGLRDGFLWRLSGDGSTTLWASYFGGTGADRFERCIDAGGGRVAVCGSSFSNDLPLSLGAWNTVPAGAEDGWFALVAGDGSSLDYSTAIGRQSGDWAVDVGHAPNGEVVVAGSTWSSNFPFTPGAVPPVGGGDTFCVRLAALPQGTARHGQPSGTCARAARIRTRSAPFVGTNAFALTCGDIPAGSLTVVGIGLSTLPSALPVLGFDLWLDPATMVNTPLVIAQSSGSAVLPIPIPATPGLAGASLAAQFVWFDACPGPSFGASDALTFTVQP